MTDAGSSLGSEVEQLIRGGGHLSIRYEKRHSLNLSLVRQGSALRVVGAIEQSRSLHRFPTPAAGQDGRSNAELEAPLVRLGALEAAGWQHDAKGAGLTRSWATDSGEDRADLLHEVARTLSILDDGSGDAQPMRYTSEANGSVDPIVGLILGAVGAAIGVVIGLLIAFLEPDSDGRPALFAGLVIGLLAGVIPGFLGMFKAVEWADRRRWFRGRLANVALAGGLGMSAGTSLVVALVIARL